MKRYFFSMVLVASALFCFSTQAHAQARPNAALWQGDTITVSWTGKANMWAPTQTYYVGHDANGGVQSVAGQPDESCLWVIYEMNGIQGATGKENTATVRVKSLSTGRYLYMQKQDGGALYLTDDPNAATVLYTVKSSQSPNEYVLANVLCKQGKNNYYLNWDYWFHAKKTNTPQTMRVQRWSKVENSNAQPTFLPNEAIFSWAGTAGEAAAQALEVTCKVKILTGSYYYNVSNPDQRIVNEAITERDPDPGQPITFAWQHSMDHGLNMSTATLQPDGLYHFTLTPTGPSPVVTDPAQHHDIADNIVCTASFSGKQVQGYMECIRRVYLQKELNPLDFTVSHASYRFPQAGGSMTLIPTLIYKPGTEWYNTDGIIEHSAYPAGSDRVVYEDHGLMVTTEIQESAKDWLSFTGYGPLEINLQAALNPTNNARSAQVNVRVEYGKYVAIDPEEGYTGTRYSLQHSSLKKDQLGVYTEVYKEDPSGTHKRTDYEVFMRQITVTQLGTMEGADIEFVHQVGQGGGSLDAQGRQKVHTSKKVMYYIPGLSGQTPSEVQLRPTEMSFYGYRRWYNYDTEHGIQNSPNPNDNTTWVDAPHIVSNNTSFNYTPINTDTEHSRGVFAINRTGSTSSGFRLLYRGMTDPAPIIKGYTNGGVHRIACDMSTYTDYEITESGGALTRVKEPTLSYRMLFELHPASEIADSIKKLATGEYLEEYEYTAPTGVDVQLVTSQRYRSYRYHESEMGYFYYKNGSNATGGYGRVGVDATSIRWYKNGASFTPNYAPNSDNVIVNSSTPGTVTYTLVVGTTSRNTTARIAKFTVKFVDKKTTGPSSLALITNDEIENNYVKLSEINFNEGDAPGNVDNVKSSHHLNWEDATYGFSYQNPQLENVRYSSKDLAFYGEYLLINRANKGEWTWIDPAIENRGGKANGYMMYVDGTLEQGLVASIQTDAEICSGQQMYCSAWIANASPSNYASGSNPIFRFNVQGRNADNEEWEDVSVFFAGELPKGSRWQQINFPLHANSKSYSQTRVCVYNFANTNDGNDFFVDDICLYATPLPLSAYQAASACVDEDIVVVVKVDYNNMEENLAGTDVFYQGWVEIPDPLNPGQKKTVAIPDLSDYNGVYMDGDEFKEGVQDYGRIVIPTKGYTPTEYVFPTVQSCIDYLIGTNGDERAGTFFVPEGEKYSMYLVHLLQAREGGNYEVRMATAVEDLAHPLCAMSVKLPIYRETKITYGKDNEDLSGPVVDACPNVDNEIKVTVTNNVTGNHDGVVQTAIGRADWLVGIPADTIYCITDKYKNAPYNYSESTIASMKAAADAAFLTYYGYTRQEVTDAFVYDLRRLPEDNQPNPNYNVTDYHALNPNYFFEEKHYNIVTSLCSRGLVDMNVGTRTVSLSPGDAIYLWVYPIVGSAILNGKELAVCNQPQWVDFRARPLSEDQSQQIINLSPIPNENKTPAQKLINGSVRVSESVVNTQFTVPVYNVQNAVLAWDSLRVISTNDPDISGRLDNERTFHMRYYSDMIYQGPNDETAIGWNAVAHNWEYYGKNGYNTITFKPIDAAHVAYLKNRHDASIGAQVTDPETGITKYSIYSQSDADWHAKEEAEGTGENSQPGYRKVNSANAQMHANYTYHMKTNLVTNSFAGELGGTLDGCTYGVAFFDVIVVPDLLIWRPKSDNEWGNDNNWHGIVNGKEMDWGFAPLSTSSVIIPTLDNPLLYPQVTGDTLYPMSAWYEPAACRNIYLEAGAHILGQEKLQYEKAYVDMTMETNEWYAMSAPLQDMYSGDLYVPHSGTWGGAYANLENQVYTLNSNSYVNTVRDQSNHYDNLFDTRTFTGMRNENAPYAFWVSFYNREVSGYQSSTEEDQTTVHTATAAFAPSNALNNTIAPGQGFQVIAFGPTDYEPFDLRLPKNDPQYYYYLYGQQSQYYVATPRSNSNKFAFTPNNGSETDMTVHLENGSAGSKFMFGNPTMAYIDMELFMEDNAAVLSGEYEYCYKSKWTAVTKSIIDISGHRYLAPMESILIETKNATPRTSIDVVVKAEHLTLNNMSYVAGNAPARGGSSAPARSNAAPAADPMQLMTIIAYTDDAEGTAYLGKQAGTKMRYEVGEDARFISSGIDVEDDVYSAINIYTVRDSNSMMVDIRPALTRIPLGFAIYDLYRTDSLTISFTTNRDWASETYFVDELTGQRARIYDGTQLTIATPNNHEYRYVIEGIDEEMADAPTGPEVATGVEEARPTAPTEEELLAPAEFIYRDGILYIRRAGRTYTTTGVRVE